MQTSDFPSSLRGDENADKSQKTTHSKGFCSLLASASTGTMSTSLNSLNAGFLDDNHSSPSKPGENSRTTSGYADSLEHGSFPDHWYTKDSNVLLMPEKKRGCRFANNVDRFSSRQNVALLCSVIVMLGLCSVALGFCGYLYHQVSGQNQTVQTVLKDYHSLRQDYQALHDDYQRLRKEFDNHMLQNEMTRKAPGEENPVSPSNGQTMQSSDALLQLLRSNGFPAGSAGTYQSRTKRSGADEERRYVENIVINYLRRMPKVHLLGMSNITDAREYRDPLNEYLLWQTDPNPFGFVHRGVTLKHVHHQHDRIKGIEIQQTGIYVVYSQVIINGTTTESWRRDCAHQTVVLPYHDNNDGNRRPHSFRVLLSGFVTQDAEGHYENHTIPFPRDSSLQMGIFRLIRQSQVRVRVPRSEDCRRTLFTTDLHSSYFGLFRIG